MWTQSTHSVQDMSYPFLSDIAAIRQRARHHIRHCVAAPGTHAATETELRLLNEALAIEVSRMCRNCSRRCIVHGAVAAPFGDECPRKSRVEHRHADRIAARILQLGGKPRFTSEEMADLRESSRTECDSLADRIEEDLIVERIAVESYSEVIQYLGGRDPITLGLFESILGVAKQTLRELARTREQMLRRNATQPAPSPE
jgi:bacterioferritin